MKDTSPAPGASSTGTSRGLAFSLGFRDLRFSDMTGMASNHRWQDSQTRETEGKLLNTTLPKRWSRIGFFRRACFALREIDSLKTFLAQLFCYASLKNSGSDYGSHGCDLQEHLVPGADRCDQQGSRRAHDSRCPWLQVMCIYIYCTIVYYNVL